MQERGRPPGGGGRAIDKCIMRLLIERPDGVTFTWLVKAGARKGIGKQTVWRHLNRFVADGLAIHNRMKKLYYPSEGVLGLHGYGGPFKIDVRSHDVGRVDEATANPFISGDGFFSLLVQRFQVVFQGYLNLLGTIREMKARPDVHALSIFLLGEMSDELLRLANEVWLQKQLVPLTALGGREVLFRVRYSDTRKPSTPQTT